MDFLSKCNQTAVYWGSPTPSGRGGNTYDDAEERTVRWEDKQELFINAQGKQELSRAVIYDGENDYDVGGYLYLGAESGLDSNHENPEIIDGAYKIKAVSKTSSIDSTEFLRKIWL